MSKIGNYILEAIDVMAQAKVDNLKFDKTVIGTIYQISNPTTGEYKVKYEDNIFTAWVENSLVNSYKNGTSVFVKIPEGDFSNKKIIEGTASNSELQQEDLTELKNYKIDVGENINATYYETENTWEIQLTEQKKYHIIKLTGKFNGSNIKNKFYLHITFNEDNNFIDFSNLEFSGTPYNMTESLQSVYINLDNYKGDIITIKLIKEEEDNVELNSLYYNYVDIIDFTQINQYLYLRKAENTLYADLISRGKSVIGQKECTVYWYQPSDENMETKTLAGYGWKEITDNREKTSLPLNGYSKIKVVTVYENTQMEAEYTVNNYSPNITITVTYNDDDATLNANKSCNWYIDGKLVKEESSIYTIKNYKNIKEDIKFTIKEAVSNG